MLPFLEEMRHLGKQEDQPLDPLTICLTGPPGTGKMTIARNIAKVISASVMILNS